jgi:hypothetical protein
MQRPLPCFFTQGGPKKNIVEPPNYLVAGTHFLGVFARNASETANGGTKMHHHKPYARAVRIVQSSISLGCSTHALRKTSYSLRITWSFDVVRIGPLTKTPYKKKTTQNKICFAVYSSLQQTWQNRDCNLKRVDCAAFNPSCAS